jgi:hypothetical protein
MTPDEAATHQPRVEVVDKQNNPRISMDLDGTAITTPNVPAITDATAHTLRPPTWKKHGAGPGN